MVAAAVGCLVGAAVTTWLHPDVDDSAISHANESLRVTATVELRSPDSMSPLQGIVAPPATQEVHPRAGDPGQVVTGMGARVGRILHAGDVVGEVSGVPVLAIPGSVPLYRDLSVGDKGNDVKALETVLRKRGQLREEPDGKATESTRKAINDLLAASGYAKLPAGMVLKLAQTAPIPDGVTVTATADVGDLLDEKHPLITVQTRHPVVTARADILSAAFLDPGRPVTITNAHGESAASKVVTKSHFNEATTDVPAGHDVEIPLPAALSLQVGEPVTISVASNGDTQAAVPLPALRQDGAQTYVLVVADAQQNTQPRRVDVVVGSQVEGYAILSDSSLTKGTLVVLTT